MGIIIPVIYNKKIVPFTGIVPEPDIIHPEFITAAVLKEYHQRKFGGKGKLRLQPEQVWYEFLVPGFDLHPAELIIQAGIEIRWYPEIEPGRRQVNVCTIVKLSHV